MSEVYVLDSFAVLALLGNEQGSDEVAKVLREAQQGSARVLMNWVNVGEVAYIVQRRWGKEEVYLALGALEATEVEIVDVDRDLALKAAGIKAEHALAYADAFAAALAAREDAVLVTGDPEFEELQERIGILWLRQNDGRHDA
ncbi:MAG: type II toxin-antitoxin system VapC family toxin [Armatimonadota bacterium]